MRALAVLMLACVSCAVDPPTDPWDQSRGWYTGPLWGDPCRLEPSSPGAIVACLHQDNGAGFLDGEHPATLGLCAPATAAEMGRFPAWTNGLELHGVCRPFCKTDGHEHYTCDDGVPVVVSAGGWCLCSPD